MLSLAEYITRVKREINISDGYRKSNIHTLTHLSKFYSNRRNFKGMARDDILLYLDSLRKPEVTDPLHKWIGTYTLRRGLIVKFFKWLFHPDIESTKRPHPEAVKNIPRLKRREQSIYKTDRFMVTRR